MNQPTIQPQTTASPLDARTFAIGILSVTACVLFVGLVLVISSPRQALATGQSDRGGDYIMITQQLSNSLEGIVVIDAAAKQLNLYALDDNFKKFQVLQRGFPLDQLPGSRQDGQPPASGRRP